MPTKTHKTKTMVPHGELLEAMLIEAPELTLTLRGDPDPRLVQLARLLGRRMARQNFEAQRRSTGS